MKQVNGYEVKEFTYSSRTERDNHVALMKEEGWNESGQVKRLKEGVSLFYATDNDREWYARFHRQLATIQAIAVENRHLCSKG